jgi:N-acetylglucosaminyl-diphospho-decaprenol L-rhamnosyltransferase
LECPPTKGGPSPTVSAVIPSVVGGPELVQLVRTLYVDGSTVEVLIADNGLPEQTLSELRDTPASIVKLAHNVGFGAAVNRAARLARGEILVVLNDDIELQPGFLDALVDAFTEDVDVVAGVLLRKEAPDLIESAGVEIDRTLSPSDYLGNEPISRLADPLPPPLGPCGGAAAYRRELFLSVGGFDEGFFAYCEDVDLAIRLRAAGARCALAPRALALHSGSRTLGDGSLAKANMVGFSRGYLLRKYRVLTTPRWAVAAVVTEAIAVLLLAARHRSFGPGLARARGWLHCQTRGPRPAEADISVPFFEGLRRRYARANRGSSARAERSRHPGYGEPKGW